MKKKQKLILALLLIPSGIWLSTIVKCEILTQKYYNDFEYAYRDNPMLGEMEYFKVLQCDKETAEVYYVSKGMAGADVLTFERKNSSWIETGWRTIWSASGSASNVVYPYWWHFVYGGF